MHLNTRLVLISLILVSSLLLSCASDDDESITPVSFSPAGMKLIAATGQSFVMGSATGLEDEQPTHTVSFASNFWMDSTEVTQGQYESLMSAHYPTYTTPTWFEPYGIGDRLPAYHVYWSDAVLYCNARSVAEGLDSVYTYSSITGTSGNLCELNDVASDLTKNGYRLPTEAEWEYACRGGTTRDLYWGEDYDPYPATSSDTTEVGTYAVWYHNSYELGGDVDDFGPHLVGSKLPNAYGLYDMAGNLYEWCHDWYGEYSSNSATDPTGPETGEYHCVRGGSWGSDVYYLRSSCRAFSVADYLYYFIGFRTVIRAQ